MSLCAVGKFVHMIDLHSGMENMIPPSKSCCTNLKNSKVWSLKNKSYRKRVFSGKCKIDWLSKILILQQGSAPKPLGYQLLAAESFSAINLWRKLPPCTIESTRKSSAAENFLNAPARACTETDIPHKQRKLTSLLEPKQIQCLSLATVALMQATQKTQCAIL